MEKTMKPALNRQPSTPASIPTASLEVSFAIRLTGFRFSDLAQMLRRLVGWFGWLVGWFG